MSQFKPEDIVRDFQQEILRAANTKYTGSLNINLDFNEGSICDVLLSLGWRLKKVNKKKKVS